MCLGSFEDPWESSLCCEVTVRCCKCLQYHLHQFRVCSWAHGRLRLSTGPWPCGRSFHITPRSERTVAERSQFAFQICHIHLSDSLTALSVLLLVRPREDERRIGGSTFTRADLAFEKSWRKERAYEVWWLIALEELVLDEHYISFVKDLLQCLDELSVKVYVDISHCV